MARPLPPAKRARKEAAVRYDPGVVTRLLPSALLVLSLGVTGCRSKAAPPRPEPTTKTSAATVEPAPKATLATSPLLAGPSTYAVIVGVLSFDEPGVAGWSKDRRKDRALHDALRARGVPAENMALVLDDAARHEEVRSAVKRMSQRAGPGSTLLFYYAGHGVRDGRGRPYFVAFDSRSKDMERTGIAIAQVAATVREHFRGDRVLFMADACYSGTLAEAVEVVARPTEGKAVKAASLTSADASNLSTNNWTFTQTVLDGLAGDGLMDRDRDGIVSLGELSEAVADAMKYREKQRHGFVTRGIDRAQAVAEAVTGSPAAGSPEAMRPGQYVMAPRPGGGGSAVAQIRAARGAERTVRFYDYNHATDDEVAATDLTAIAFERHPVGSKLRVFWGHALWNAEVLETDGDFHFITYPGWGPEWNEWVMSDRIAGNGGTDDKGEIAEVVEVEWRGKWWPAEVRRQEGDRYLIRYVGYGPEWDEWVTDARMRRAASRP